jgi:beta-glucosidase
MQGFTDLLAAMAFLLIGKHQLTSQQIFPNSTYPGAVDPNTENGAQFLQKSDPFYPSPWMTPGTMDWADAYEKAKDFVSQLTLMEKVNLTTGVGCVVIVQTF